MDRPSFRHAPVSRGRALLRCLQDCGYCATGTTVLNSVAQPTRVIELDGVYDPWRPNERLLLQMKGSISEFGPGTDRGLLCCKQLRLGVASCTWAPIGVHRTARWDSISIRTYGFVRKSTQIFAQISKLRQRTTGPSVNEGRSSYFRALFGRQKTGQLD